MSIRFAPTENATSRRFPEPRWPINWEWVVQRCSAGKAEAARLTRSFYLTSLKRRASPRRNCALIFMSNPKSCLGKHLPSGSRRRESIRAIHLIQFDEPQIRAGQHGSGYPRKDAHRGTRMKWQPIETAPRDGTNVLLWTGDIYLAHEIASWDWRIEKWVTPDETLEIGSQVPTHWLPLPEPPVKL